MTSRRRSPIVEQVIVSDDAAVDDPESLLGDLCASDRRTPGSSLRSLMLGSPPPTTNRSPRRTPDSTGAEVMTLSRTGNPSRASRPLRPRVRIFMFEPGIMSFAGFSENRLVGSTLASAGRARSRTIARTAARRKWP